MNNSIYQTLQHYAQQQAEKVAFYLADGQSLQYTYGDLIKLIEDYRQYFATLGIQEQSIIACALNNGRALFELTVSAYATNRILLPLNLVAGDKNLHYVLAHAQPQIIFANSDTAPKMRALAPQGMVILEVEDEHSALQNSSGVTKSPQADRQTDTQADTQAVNTRNSLLMYTSGTTGNPKGVMLSDNNLLAGGKNTAMAHQLTKNDVGLCVLPLYHINAQCVSIMSTIYAGSSLVLATKFSVSSFFPLIDKYKISWASVVPTMLVFLLNCAENGTLLEDRKMIKNLRFIRSASAPLPIEVHHQVEQWLGVPIIETMGITEASAQILSNPMPPATRKIGSVGIAYGNEVKILDENLHTVAVGEEGEVCVKGDNVMFAYYKNPDATAETLQQGWLRTGDIAKIDEDGYFYISGRTKELIIKGGENIAPREIDEVLYMHPAVIEAAAFATPCANYGQKIEVCIKKDSKVNVDGEQIKLFCQQHLGKFKSPDVVHFIDELPKGPSGKIQRLKLYEILYASEQ